MSDHFELETGVGINTDANAWYRKIDLLGTGGNSATFLCICSSPVHLKGSLAAVKFFRRISRPDRKQRFLEEREFLRGNSHPAVMPVFDEGVYRRIIEGNTCEYPFLVAEYYPKTLRMVMRSRDASLVEKVSYAMQLISALNYLHGQDPPVVHRDIKPENIFIKGQTCILGDFGLMKRLDGSDDPFISDFQASTWPAMPAYYRTPELVAYIRNEHQLTPASDVFQLGLVLAELFTGFNPLQPPLTDEDGNFIYTSPIRLSDLGTIPGLCSGGIASLINRMIDTNTDTRDTAEQLIDPWEGVFWEAVRMTQDLEGRAFR